MWFGILTLATALIISVSAAYYSILGLTAIFAAAFWPIVILGSSLEVGKIVSTLWLHKYWDRAELQYKVYLCSAVAILMLLTSMGVFGFLSKAHSDQSLVSGDVTAKIAIYDEKIKQARDNIAVARSALAQMDAAVDQTMSRSTTESGADKAAQLRRSQAGERNRLLKEIDTEQKKIQTLNDQRAPIAAEVRKVEAEVGPIKYIAALIYGDNPEANVLEKAVRWVIILIVIVFDPLALTLLLAATKTLEWERGLNILAPATKRNDEDEDSEVKKFFDKLRNRSRAIDDGTYQVAEEPNPYQDIKPDQQHWYDQAQVDQPSTTVTEPARPMGERGSVPHVVPVGKDLSADDILFEQFFQEQDQSQPEKKPQIDIVEPVKVVPVHDEEAEHAPLENPDDHEDADPIEKQAMRAWKEAHPRDTIKKYRILHNSGYIKELPWKQAAYHPAYALPEKLQADNDPTGAIGEVKGFGINFPAQANKGDMFLRVDQLPTALYKYNGANWIAVDKNLSENYAYDKAYINHLIEKISTGEYDPDLLSDAERSSIEQYLQPKTDQ